MKSLIAFALVLAACGGSAVYRPDAGSTHCGNGNVYCTADEVCISGDCVPACYFSDGGCMVSTARR